MKAQLIYSVAALATFPIVVNAQVNADNIGKITAKKDGTAWTKNIELAPGKYTFKSAISTGTAGKKATVSILAGATPIVTDFDVTVGAAISKDFTLDATTTVTIKVVSETASADFIADESVVQLNFNFSKVAELLQIEYNKVTQILGQAQYADKVTDAQTHSALYDRVMAIANADYTYYKNETEGLKALYAGDQTVVTGLSLYTEIQNAISSVKTKELAYLDGNDALGGLNTRYNKLADTANGGDYEISYITLPLSGAKTAAKNARDAFELEPTAANLIAAKNKIGEYKTEIETVEGIKDANEAANNDLKTNLDLVYGGATSYYKTSLDQIDALYKFKIDDQFIPEVTFTNLINDVKTKLSDIVNSTDYTDVKDHIQNAYTAKTSDDSKNDLINEIAAFKEILTRAVSEHNAQRDRLVEVYKKYDKEAKAANTLGATDFLEGYKNTVDSKVNALKLFIEARDHFATIPSLTDDAIDALIADITDAKTTYSAQKAIYDDWRALLTEVGNETPSLTNAGTAIDAYAKGKDAKYVDNAVFKPTTIWANTISDITTQIENLTNDVNTNKLIASTYKNSDAYKNALRDIKKAISDLKTNANAATDIFATADAKVKAAQALQAALLAPTVAPLVDLTTLNVWENQVYIDEEVMKRTPYKKFINSTDGTITGEISTMESKLAAAPGKTAQYTTDTNLNNVLAYLKSIAPTPADVLKDELATMEAIKANYTADNDKFTEQLDIEAANGIRIMINGKAAEFEPLIAALQTRITNGEFGSLKGATLQTEINTITAKINAAKLLAADDAATKAQLSAEYDKIKNLDTQDIATAQGHATQYATDFATFTGRYNTLNGATTDAVTAQTVNGLKNKVKAQQDDIAALPKLSADQKTALKNKVAAVQVVKQEGTPAADVTYTVQNIYDFIATAWQNETLTDADVTKYQGIINDLKSETEKVKTQADNLNDLETQLAAIDFNAAETAIKAKDGNPDGFYLKKLLGNAAAGECTFDFNALKRTIEADVDITAAEVTTYGGQITALNTTITGLATLADNNLNAWKDVKDAYSKDAVPSNPAIWGNGGAVQQYDAAMAKLEADFVTSKLEDQKMALATLKEALDASKNTAEEHYNAGTATAADKTDLLSKLDAIKNQWEEYTNEVNYNGQIAADNKAIWEAANAAHADADVQYAVSSSIINTYKLFKSNELKAATEKAQTELQDLLTYLEGYDAKVAEIQGRVDNTYGKIVSPEKFDTKETFKAEFEAVKAELKTKTQTLSDKIKEYASEPVNASATTYTNAIAASKAKVVKFSATDADVPAATVDGWFTAIDGLLTAINNVKDDDTKIKDLDTALKNASASGSGIKDQITSVEQTQATAALTTIIGAISTTDWSQWAQADKDDYNTIAYNINNRPARCVNNFASYKDILNRINGNAEQIALDNAAIAGATGAITTANNELNELIGDYQDCAAGAQVKATVDQIKADLDAHPASGVTVANSAAEKSAAEAISARIVEAYNALFDAEVTVIQGLITTAKQENLTYSGADKATISGYITDQEGYLNDATTAVALPTDDPGYWTKKDALKSISIAHNLKTIEAALNDYIKTMTDGNATNINDAVAGELNTKVGAQQDRLEEALDILNEDIDVYGYDNVYGDKDWYHVSGTGLNTKKNEIQTSINTLSAYISTHFDEITAYKANAEAMLADIQTAITNLENDAQAAQNTQHDQFVTNNAILLETKWNTAEGYITTAQGKINQMNEQLDYYGSASKYANKVSKLENQIAAATEIFTTAKAEAESLTTLKAKYDKAIAAGTNITNALDGVADNSTDIINMAETAYINTFIDNLRSQVIAKTWTNSSNYTTTDKGILDGKWDAIRAKVGYVENDVETEGSLKTDAKAIHHAQDIQYIGWTSKGVINFLDEGKATFNDMLSELKQLLKDMSLEEDVKGHISGNDDISIDDLEDLADIILNAQEESADLSRCDISGDGEVDVTDLVWLRYFLVHGDWPNSAATARGDMASANDYINMEVVSVENNVTRIAINLDNETVFNHFQLNVQLPEGAKVVGQTLGERVEGANLMMAQNGTTVRMLAISTANNVFAGNEGAVVYIDIEGLNGEVNIEKAIFTDTELNGHLLTANSTTSIRESITNALQAAGQKIYNMGGKMMNGLKKGVNIIRNADGSAKKVMK